MAPTWKKAASSDVLVLIELKGPALALNVQVVTVLPIPWMSPPKVVALVFVMVGCTPSLSEKDSISPHPATA
jgi:hypothetical protein